jgi:energy-coupling factor transporter ATP-binding protein EcfA2
VGESALLTTRDLEVRFTTSRPPALTGANLDLSADSATWFLGPNGSGKSTLALACAGLVPGVVPAERLGSVRLDGEDPATLPPRERVRRVGLILQDPEAQLAAPSVRSELALILENQGVSAEEIDLAVGEVVEELGIAHLADRRVHRLSGGEKQLVAIAAFAVRPPKVLFLDEPGAYLDHENRRRLYRFLGTLRRSRHSSTLILVEHRTDGLPEPDHVVTLSEGTVAEVAAAGQIAPKAWGSSFPTLPRRRSTSSPVVRLEKLSFSWSRAAETAPLLKEIDLELRPGEVTVIQGANGSGKTTLLRLIAGARKPTSGRIVRSESGRRAYMPQNPEHLFVSYTVWSELEEASSYGNRWRGELAAEAAPEVLAQRFGLEDLLEANPFELSTGQKRRVNMAIAAAVGATVALLDEPTFGLDAPGVCELIHLVERLRDEGATTLLVTHDSSFAAAVADRLLTIHDGALHEESTVG